MAKTLPRITEDDVMVFTCGQCHALALVCMPDGFSSQASGWN
jgi:hypothetical protein